MYVNKTILTEIGDLRKSFYVFQTQIERILWFLMTLITGNQDVTITSVWRFLLFSQNNVNDDIKARGWISTVGTMAETEIVMGCDGSDSDQ